MRRLRQPELTGQQAGFIRIGSPVDTDAGIVVISDRARALTGTDHRTAGVAAVQRQVDRKGLVGLDIGITVDHHRDVLRQLGGAGGKGQRAAVGGVVTARRCRDIGGAVVDDDGIIRVGLIQGHREHKVGGGTVGLSLSHIVDTDAGIVIIADGARAFAVSDRRPDDI